MRSPFKFFPMAFDILHAVFGGMHSMKYARDICSSVTWHRPNMVRIRRGQVYMDKIQPNR